jgi:hypothetical protein
MAFVFNGLLAAELVPDFKVDSKQTPVPLPRNCQLILKHDAQEYVQPNLKNGHQRAFDAPLRSTT